MEEKVKEDMVRLDKVAIDFLVNRLFKFKFTCEALISVFEDKIYIDFIEGDGIIFLSLEENRIEANRAFIDKDDMDYVERLYEAVWEF